MCEANVYLVDDDGKIHLVLESVDKIIPSNEGLVLENIFSERKTVNARIKEMSLASHRVFLEKTDA